MSAKVISVMIPKGGTGKTTSTINISANLLMNNKKVLDIDIDPQRNLIKIFVPELVNVKNNIATVLNEQDKFSDVIKNICGLGIVPTSESQNELNMTIQDVTCLKTKLEEIKEKYDFILIDNSPAVNKLTYCSLVASDYLLVPCQVNTESLDAVNELLLTINEHNFKELNPNLKILGMFFNQYNLLSKRQNKIQKEIIDNFRRISGAFDIKLFDTSIPQNIALQNASTHHQDIFRFDDKSTGAKAYASLTTEILQELNMEE